MFSKKQWEIPMITCLGNWYRISWQKLTIIIQTTGSGLRHCWNFKILHYLPQLSCGKVMFIHLSVILFTGRVSVQEGGSLSGRPPPATIRLRAGGTHPTGMHSFFLILRRQLQKLWTVYKISENSVHKNSYYLIRTNKCQNQISFARILSVFVRIYWSNWIELVGTH